MNPICLVPPEYLAEICDMLDDGIINQKGAEALVRYYIEKAISHLAPDVPSEET